nr:hypothetical protein [Haloquadratum walsbyi]
MSFVPAPIPKQSDGDFDPTMYTFPTSSLADDVQLEGIVIRSPTRDRRVKLVREAFQECNREQFGQRSADADSGVAYVVATYCTSARIRKQVRTLVVEEGREFVFISMRTSTSVSLRTSGLSIGRN